VRMMVWREVGLLSRFSGGGICEVGGDGMEDECLRAMVENLLWNFSFACASRLLSTGLEFGYRGV
jgi:hypothetical protein